MLKAVHGAGHDLAITPGLLARGGTERSVPAGLELHMSTPVPSAGALNSDPLPEPTSEDVLAVIRRILHDELELQREVNPGDALLADLELDSLGLITVAVGLENRYRVKLSEQESMGIVTVADLVAHVRRRVAEEAAK